MIRVFLGICFNRDVVAVNVLSGGAVTRWVWRDADGVQYVQVHGNIYRFDHPHLKNKIWLTREIEEHQ